MQKQKRTIYKPFQSVRTHQQICVTDHLINYIKHHIQKPVCWSNWDRVAYQYTQHADLVIARVNTRLYPNNKILIYIDNHDTTLNPRFNILNVYDPKKPDFNLTEVIDKTTEYLNQVSVTCPST